MEYDAIIEKLKSRGWEIHGAFATKLKCIRELDVDPSVHFFHIVEITAWVPDRCTIHSYVVNERTEPYEAGNPYPIDVDDAELFYKYMLLCQEHVRRM